MKILIITAIVLVTASLGLCETTSSTETAVMSVVSQLPPGGTKSWEIVHRQKSESAENIGFPGCSQYSRRGNEWHLRRIMRSYIAYYHRSRTHLSLCKDAPEPRAKQPPDLGAVIEIAEVGGLHHRYERRAA